MTDQLRRGPTGQRQRIAAARSTDPQTSHDAAYRERDLRASQREVLQLYVRYGAMDDRALVAAAAREQCRQSPSGLRTRRSELVRRGLVRDSGRRAPTDAARRTHAIVWERVPTESPTGGMEAGLARLDAVT